MSSVSVIIVSYHTGPILARCLESVLSQKQLHEVILVDNGNDQATRDSLKQLSDVNPQLVIRKGHGNIGFAGGCNLGVAQASGDFVLLLNPDCVLQPDTLVKMTTSMQSYDDVWMAGCQHIDPDGQIHGGNKRQLLTPKIALSHAIYLNRFSDTAPHVNIPEKAGEDTQYVPAISGAFMMLERIIYEEIGGLDEGYFFHVEDLDFCKTINERGGRILYVPSVQVMHYRSSSQVTSLFIERYKSKGFIRYFDKHYKAVMPFWLYPFMKVAIYARLVLRALPQTVLRFFEQRRQRGAVVKRERQIEMLHRVSDLAETRDDLADRTVLVAGATGQVGLAVVRRLLQANVVVKAMYHQQAIDYSHDHLQWVQGNVKNGFFSFDKTAFSSDVTTLVHTPAIWYLPDQLAFYQSLGIKRIIAFSSTSIEGKSGSENPYEKELIDKFVTAEKRLSDESNMLGIEVTILRPTMIYGFGLDRNVSSIVRFVERFGFFPIAKPGAGLRQPVHADDLAQAVLQVIPNANTYQKTYNVCGGEELSYDVMVERIMETMGKKPRVYKLASLPFFLDVFAKLTGNPETNGEVAKRMNRDLSFSYTSSSEDFGYKPRAFLQAGKQDLGWK